MDFECRHAKLQKCCWREDSMVCSAVCRMDWGWAGVGGGGTESQRCSVTAIHATSKYQGWLGKVHGELGSGITFPEM